MRTRTLFGNALGIGVGATLCAAVQAEYRSLVGYNELEAQLGGGIPTGETIQVIQVEAGTNYMPSYTGELAGKFRTNVTNTSSGTSGHATTVAINFFGTTTSIAPGIGSLSSHPILNYGANDWLTNFLTAGTPGTTTARVVNHSWVGGSANDFRLRQVDFTVDADDLVHVAGLANNDTPNKELLNLWRDGFNIITVGRTDGGHYVSTTSANPGTGAYTAGRTVPTVVGPVNATSFAVPMVSAGTALLLDAAQTHPSWSNGSYTNRTRTITHAESSEVIKAVIMAGADRFKDNASGADLTSYTVNTANGLSSTYGAGQFNIFSSYNILAGGEHDSSQDGNAMDIALLGWDYDPEFGGTSGSNSTGSYFFDAPGNGSIIASLVWNHDVNVSALHNLDLALIDITAGSSTVASSLSTIDNTENIWYSGLISGHQYELRVASIGSFNWDYALAWQIIPEPGTACIVLLVCTVAIHRRRIRGGDVMSQAA